jgi:hypothetical protein
MSIKTSKNSTSRATDNTRRVSITGIRRPMVPFTSRIPEDEAETAIALAKLHDCYAADFLRTAWTEYIANHNCREVLAKAAKKQRKSKAK